MSPSCCFRGIRQVAEFQYCYCSVLLLFISPLFSFATVQFATVQFCHCSKLPVPEVRLLKLYEMQVEFMWGDFSKEKHLCCKMMLQWTVHDLWCPVFSDVGQYHWLVKACMSLISLPLDQLARRCQRYVLTHMENMAVISSQVDL